jgi:tetratricopeptide (TPR) repeat protein
MAPYDTAVHAQLALVAMRAGLADEAVEWAKFAVMNDPHPLALYFLILYWAYRDSGKLNEAVKLAETQIARDPNSSKWWYDLLAKSYLATGQYKKAQETWKKAISMPEPPID